MKNDKLKAARRLNTIAQLKEQMHAAQMRAVRQCIYDGLQMSLNTPCKVSKTAPKIGVWRGGC